MTPDIVRAGVQERLDRLGVDSIDLLQFHWWTFEHPAWLDALHEMARLREEGLIGAIGVTNFDAAHLALALADGIPIATQPGLVLAARPPRRRRADRRSAPGRGVRLLAYGTLCGGFLADSWLGAAEPADDRRLEPVEIQALHRRRRRLGAVPGHPRGRRGDRPQARRLDLQRRDALGAGAAGGGGGHRRRAASPRASTAPTTSRVFGFALDAEDRARLDAAFAATTPIPGDCGDEYRKPPFLTASGDLSHHLDAHPAASTAAEPVPGRPGRLRVSSGSVWEPIAGYSRARAGRRPDPASPAPPPRTAPTACVAPGDAGAQTTYILDKIAAALTALGGDWRTLCARASTSATLADWEPVSRAHGRCFGDVRPANTLVAVPALSATTRSRSRPRLSWHHSRESAPRPDIVGGMSGKPTPIARRDRSASGATSGPKRASGVSVMADEASEKMTPVNGRSASIRQHLANLLLAAGRRARARRSLDRSRIAGSDLAPDLHLAAGRQHHSQGAGAGVQVAVDVGRGRARYVGGPFPG